MFSTIDLYLARGQRRVDRVGAARGHPSGDGDHTLEANSLGVGKRGTPRGHHALGDPEVIAQVEKEKIAVIAATMHPARESHRLPESARRSSPLVWVRYAVRTSALTFPPARARGSCPQAPPRHHRAPVHAVCPPHAARSRMVARPTRNSSLAHDHRQAGTAFVRRAKQGLETATGRLEPTASPWLRSRRARASAGPTGAPRSGKTAVDGWCRLLLRTDKRGARLAVNRGRGRVARGPCHHPGSGAWGGQTHALALDGAGEELAGTIRALRAGGNVSADVRTAYRTTRAASCVWRTSGRRCDSRAGCIVAAITAIFSFSTCAIHFGVTQLRGDPGECRVCRRRASSPRECWSPSPDGWRAQRRHDQRDAGHGEVEVIVENMEVLSNADVLPCSSEETPGAAGRSPPALPFSRPAARTSATVTWSCGRR